MRLRNVQLKFEDEYDAINRHKSSISLIGRTLKYSPLFDDVKKACRKKQAFLFSGQDCFLVMKPIIRNEVKGLLIWIGVSYKKVDLDYYHSEVERLAAMIDARFIHLFSARKGMAKILPPFGYTSHSSTFNNLPITLWEKIL